MTGGDDILYLITLRNLEIHLVIGIYCFEVCFGTGLLTLMALLADNSAPGIERRSAVGDGIRRHSVNYT